MSETILTTPMTAFFEPVRAILGDWDENVRQYKDLAICAAVRTVIATGGGPAGLLVTEDKNHLVPAIAQMSDFGRIVYRVCLMFLRPGMEKTSYRTRALAESFGGTGKMVEEMKTALYELENGEMFASFTTFRSWVNSSTGVSIWEQLSGININAPFQTVSVGRSGIIISGSNVPNGGQAAIQGGG